MGGRQIRYCDPVGSHPGMTDLLLKNASLVAPGTPPEETTLILVGHGTRLNANSRRAVGTQVERIREHPASAFASVEGAFLEESPLISEWDKLVNTPFTVVVPFFISDGLHSYQDIPALLGIKAEASDSTEQVDVFGGNPYHLRGCQLYYSPAIGNDSSIADLILDQARTFDAG